MLILLLQNDQRNHSKVLNDNLITCSSNDYGFDYWIKNVLKYYVIKRDFVIFS